MDSIGICRHKIVAGMQKLSHDCDSSAWVEELSLYEERGFNCYPRHLKSQLAFFSDDLEPDSLILGAGLVSPGGRWWTRLNSVLWTKMYQI
jgi:hypothetical protein